MTADINRFENSEIIGQITPAEKKRRESKIADIDRRIKLMSITLGSSLLSTGSSIMLLPSTYAIVLCSVNGLLILFSGCLLGVEVKEKKEFITYWSEKDMKKIPLEEVTIGK